MTEMLPHAVIVTGSRGCNLDPYLEERQQAHDEVLRIDEHPNQSKTNTGIYIEDIRELQTAVRAGKRGGRTIVVLQDAAKMTLQSQNALLKLLEEPRPGLHLLLYTFTPMQLLATIRSRCQIVKLSDSSYDIELPAEKAAQITFMADGIPSEQTRLANDTRYFERRVKLFELAKQFIGGTSYDRLVVAKQVADKRDTALEFIDVALIMYAMLMKRRFAPKLRDEATLLLEVETALRQNASPKLQFLRFVVQ